MHLHAGQSHAVMSVNDGIRGGGNRLCPRRDRAPVRRADGGSLFILFAVRDGAHPTAATPTAKPRDLIAPQSSAATAGLTCHPTHRTASAPTARLTCAT